MKSKQVRIDERVIRILILAGDVVFITPEIVQPLFPEDTTGESCMRRLRQLAAARLLGQIELPYRPGRSRGGRPPVAYYLTPRGAQLVTTITGRRPRFLRSAPSLRTILHRIGYGQILLRLRDAATKARLPSMDWHLEYDLVPGVPPGAPMAQRFKLYEQFRGDDGRTVTCWADASCWQRLPAQARDLLFYLEYDRGYDHGADSETIGEVAGKLPGCHQLLTTSAYKRHWPQITDPKPIVRVLFQHRCEDANRSVANVLFL